MSSKLPVIAQDVLLPDELQDLVNKVCKIVPWEIIEKGTPEERKQIEGLFVFLHPKIDGALMDLLPSLKVISNFGVGVDHISLEDAKKRNIPVGNTPNCLEDCVADMGMALLLASARNIVEGDHIAHDPETKKFDPNWFGVDVTGSTIGIIGLGRIGIRFMNR